MSRLRFLLLKADLSKADLLVKSTLRDCSIQEEKRSPAVSKCNHPRCPNCPFLKQGQANYTFTSTKEKRRIHDPLNNKSKSLIYLFECKKSCKQYIGETKRHLHQPFGSIAAPFSTMATLIPNPTLVSEHFNQADHSIDDVLLIPLELIRIRTVTLSERHARLTSLTKL